MIRVPAVPFLNRVSKDVFGKCFFDEYELIRSAIAPTNELGQTMSEGKDADRSRRKKRRGQLDREKETRRAEQSRTANLESKTKDEKAKLDLRIGKLIDQGYSPESVAKRVGVSLRRINSALDSNSRR